jgi:hypothetical protein
MLAPPTFPKWLPPAVALEAQRILSTENADTALVLRLATDERMKPVWHQLKKFALVSAKPSEWSELVSDRSGVQLPPPHSDALTQFFWCVYMLAIIEPAVGHFSGFDLPIASYHLVAARLRLAAATLRQLKLQYGQNVDLGNQFTDIHASQIEEAATFCDEHVEAFSKINTAEAPLRVNRIHGNREARGYVRMLAAEARKLFGKAALGNRTLARVASVALAKKVSETQVRKWCHSLNDK